MLTPERLVWPFWPRPAVLPLPEPMPRPTRIRPLRAPSLSLSSLSFMSCTRFRFCRAVPRRKAGVQSQENTARSAAWPPAFAGEQSDLFDAHQMLHLADLAEDLGGPLHFHGAAELVQAQADERRALGLVAADRGSG